VADPRRDARERPLSRPSVFVDTNVLAYARDLREPRKQAIAQRWLEVLAGRRAGRVSWQVLSEFHFVATHPRKLAAVSAQARADVVALQAWNPCAVDSMLFETAWRLADRYRFAWWDALIVAAARRCECEILLSEDLHNGLVVDGTLRIVDPFSPDAPDPESPQLWQA